MTLTGKDIAAAIGGRCLSGADRRCTGISTDTRTLGQGNLFVALRGESFDGHAFIHQAIDKGAAGVVVEEGWDGWLQGHIVVEVPDALHALGSLARAHLAPLPAARIAITGSNGKTGTKEMAAFALAAYGAVTRTRGNFNNLVGLPLTAFEVGSTDAFAVFEMGMNRPGEIARLAEIVQPRVGLVTAVAEAHLEGLGSIDAVARAKGELYQALGKDAVAIVNARDAWCVRAAEGTKARVLRVGVGKGADVSVEGIRRTGVAGFAATLHLGGKPFDLRLRALGRHEVWNAALAVAVLDALGLDPAAGIAALERYAGMPGRLAWRVTAAGVNVIDDAYNANPASMRAALETLAEVGQGARRIAVLGDMRELGGSAAALHERIGQTAAELDTDVLLAVGSYADEVARGFGDGVVTAGDCADILDTLTKMVRPGDWVLVKGSHSMHMERAVAALLGDGGAQ